MKTLEILGKTYEDLGTIERLTVADSFVTPKNKIGAGNGEAKLYVGQRNSIIEDFFGPKGFNVKCFLLKKDLVSYIQEIRKEHIAPTQEYREKENFAHLWDNKYNQALGIEDVLSFDAQDQSQIHGDRVYLNSSSKNYTILRDLALPIISHLNITKLRNINNDVIEYYIYIYSDYSFDIAEEEEPSSDDLEFKPFNPELISIDTKKIAMETIIRRLKQGTIDLNPDFQRNYVWTSEKKSQLIESLILKIPLPMFYVAADKVGNYIVVDGLQRISTLRDYIVDQKFSLQKLEFWGDQYNDYHFDDLPTIIQNRILETEFTFTVINEGTPDAVKRNIFKRVNRGGLPLTDQEIRNALYTGEATVLLKNLALKESFLEATDSSIKTERMLDKEFILRSLTFIIQDYTTYPKSGDMDSFLCETLQIINKLKNQNASFEKTQNFKINTIKDIEQYFILSMDRAMQIFGEHTFRKSFPGQRRTPINKSLFEVWATILSKLSQNEFSSLLQNKKDFLNDYKINFLQDYRFDDIISRRALQYASVIDRHRKLQTLVEKYIK